MFFLDNWQKVSVHCHLSFLQSSYDFLLAISDNLGPILHCFWDKSTYWMNVTHFFSFFYLVYLIGVTTFQISEKALWILKLESSWQQTIW